MIFFGIKLTRSSFIFYKIPHFWIVFCHTFIRGQGRKGRNGLVKWPSERIVSQGKWRA